ncbi:MAG: tyrosine-type recombinase/integrase [Hyphomicrobiaceae bacterium]
MAETHTIMGGKVHLYRRGSGRHWQCAAYLAGRNRRVTTKEESLAKAKDFAEDWYLELKGKLRRGEIKTEKTFAEAAGQFMKEFPVITEGNRHPAYVEGHRIRLRVYLTPFFGKLGLSEVTAGKLQEYRMHRRTMQTRRGKPPARNTLHQEMVCLRQVLKTGLRHGWLTHLPDMSEPYRAAGKIAHRAWFSAEEYKKLYEATRRRALAPRRERYRWECEQLHDYVLFMANTGLRPDEAARLEYRDVSVIDDEGSSETILEIEVRGKRGVGYCKSTAGAVHPFRRLQERNDPKPTDRLFPKSHRVLLGRILKEEGLKHDREGNARTAYSLRHTYICLRLLEGADIYQIAKNCRTSVEMIEKYYAVHLKNRLDASAINRRKARRRRQQQAQGEKGSSA